MATRRRFTVKDRTPFPTGLPADASGGATVDPTANVIALSAASNIRQDDLRDVFNLLQDEKVRRLEQNGEHLKDVAELRDQHAKEMRKSEADRLDSIRQVDVTAVRTEATRALEAIQTLAATSARDAETLRNALVNTASTIASQTADTVKQIVERIAALERSSYEGVGKQRLADPMMAELVAEMKGIREVRASSVGQGLGRSEVIAWVVAAAAVGGFLVKYLGGH